LRAPCFYDSIRIEDQKVKQIPDAIEKRDILHGHKKLSVEQKELIGLSLKDAGWTSDALDFLTNNKIEIEKIKKTLIEEGNVFLLLKIFRILNEENQSELLQATANAEAQGKTRYALKGYEKLGRTEKYEALKSSVADDGDMINSLNSVFIPKSEEEREEEIEE
jgi:hypothetical protein